jgi:MFS family permease
MPSSPVALVGIPLIAVILAVFFVWLVDRAAPTVAPAKRRRRIGLIAAGTLLWLAALALLALSGLLARFELRPPPLAILIAGCIAAGFGLGFSRVGGWLAQGLPLWLLVGWQAFRLPLELVMHQAAEDGLMPSALSFSGYNFDILTGSSALLLSLLLARYNLPRALVLAWNLLGIAALVMIAVIAVLTAPFIHALGNDQINSWVAYFPYVWLPGVMVVLAIAGHIAVSRRLLSEAREKPAPHGPLPA